MSANECFNLLLKDVFWSMRDELKADRYLGGLTNAEKHWDTNMEDIGPDYGLTSRYSKSLKKLKRAVSLSNYLGVVHWMESLVDEEYKPQVRKLVDGLMLDGHFAPEKKPKKQKKQKKSRK